MKKQLLLILAIFLTGCIRLDDIQTGYQSNPISQQTETKKIDYEAIQESGYAYYFDQLTEEQKYIYSDLHDVEVNRLSELNFDEPVSKNDYFTAFTAYRYDNPQAYWMMHYQYYTDSFGDVVSKVEFQIPNNLEEELTQVNQIADSVVASAATLPSEYEKAKYFYEWIINQTVYQNNDRDQDFTSVFLLQASVCEGYAKAFQYLCKKAGIDCSYVRGNTTNGLHAWNFIKLNVQYYWVDATWGDPIFEDSNEQSLNYYYFFVPDEVLYHSHLTIDGNVMVNMEESIPAFTFPKCTDNSLSYYVQNGLYYTTYDYASIHELVLTKLAQDSTAYIEFQFSTEDAYQQALYDLFTQQYPQIQSILNEIYYYGYQYVYYYNDDVYTIGLQME
ncbi:MAG: hypothetical protein MR283_01935 [Erysipelotrichaceae bacterium]|nr:hypothetical protein [Erysipelotrichaceae bacterium]MDY6035272.1 transglutaminase domain-containing protein [Bulleidia sp.]